MCRLSPVVCFYVVRSRVEPFGRTLHSICLVAGRPGYQLPVTSCQLPIPGSESDPGFGPGFGPGSGSGSVLFLGVHFHKWL